MTLKNREKHIFIKHVFFSTEKYIEFNTRKDKTAKGKLKNKNLVYCL